MSDNFPSTLRWYLLYTKVRHEDQVSERLRQAGYEVLNPKIEERKIYRRKLQNIVSPLFPRYVFLRMNIEKDYRNACYTRGVVRLVGAPAAPATIDDSLIETIRARLNEEGVAPFRAETFAPGDEVMVMDGPFAGLVGVFLKPMNGAERVSILLKAIHVRVDVDTALVRLSKDA